MIKNDLKLCVRCFTYNQAEYIVDAMNGFTMQQTDFPFVCTIVDDASTDGEPEVIRKYLQEHFNLEDKDIVLNEETDDYVMTFVQHNTNHNCYFAVYFLKYNHYKKKSKMQYLTGWMEDVEYVALCEGDDYWIHPRKLQIQVDFLDNNRTFSGVFGNRIIYYEERGVYEKIKYIKKELTLSDIMSGTLMSLQNLCYRNDANKIPCMSNSNGDFIISYRSAKLGKLKYLDLNLAVYRCSGKGISTSRTKEEAIEHTYKDWYVFHKEVGFRYNKELAKLDIYAFIWGAFLKRDLKLHLKYLKAYHSPSSFRYIWYIIGAFEYIHDCLKKHKINHKQIVDIKGLIQHDGL